MGLHCRKKFITYRIPKCLLTLSRVECDGWASPTQNKAKVRYFRSDLALIKIERIRGNEVLAEALEEPMMFPVYLVCMYESHLRPGLNLISNRRSRHAATMIRLSRLVNVVGSISDKGRALVCSLRHWMWSFFFPPNWTTRGKISCQALVIEGFLRYMAGSPAQIWKQYLMIYKYARWILAGKSSATKEWINLPLLCYIRLV